MSALDDLKAAAERLAEAERVLEAAQDARDRAVMEASEQGAKVFDLQAATGLSAARINQIKARQRALGTVR